MDLLHRLFYTALSLSTLFYFIVKISQSHWKNRGILHEKPKFLWGNLKGVGKKRHISSEIQRLYTKYKSKAPFIGCYAFLRPLVFILDLDVVRHVLTKDSSHFMERGLYHNVADDPLSGNLLQLDGEQWQHLREKLKSSFAAEKVQHLLPALLRVAGTFERSLKEQMRIDENCNVTKLVDAFNVDVISSLAFGLDGDSLQYTQTEFRAMSCSYWKNFSLLKAYLAWSFPNLARFLRYKTYDEEVSDYFLRLINDRLQEREWNRIQQRNEDFLTLFAALKSNPLYRLDTKEIAAQAFSFIAVGLEASNATLSFCLYELAQRLELQQQARDEIANALQRHNGEINAECLKELQFLRRILYETLRKHSPYPFLLRNTIKDYEVPNSVFMLKQNNHIVIPVAAIHHDPDIYPQPEHFDPDRFLPAAVKQRHAMAFLPFGAGPRHCIAKDFAELHMLVCLVTLLRHCEFSPCAETPTPLQYDPKKLLLAPHAALKLRVARI